MPASDAPRPANRLAQETSAYLRQLAPAGLLYVGLLGPRHRRERLLGELGADGRDLAARLRGPAGLDLGGRGPAPIALSIIAEMQQVLAADQGPA